MRINLFIGALKVKVSLGTEGRDVEHAGKTAREKILECGADLFGKLGIAPASAAGRIDVRAFPHPRTHTDHAHMRNRSGRPFRGAFRAGAVKAAGTFGVVEMTDS